MPPSPARRNARFTVPGVAPSAEVARRSVEVRDGSLRMVVVADTHSSPHPKGAARIAAEKPDCIVHAGDIGNFGVLSELERIAPLFAVRGNIDAPASEIPEVLTLDLTTPARILLRILLVHIAVVGPKLRGDIAGLARKEGASLVICGHSHVPFIGRDKGLAVFNPGSIGPRRFQLPIVFGVLEVANERVRMHHVDCETGALWEP